MAQIFKSLIGETLEFSWPITTSGQIIPLEGRNLSLVLVGPDNVEIPLDYTIEHTNVVCFTYEGANQSVPGIYTATLYENRGEENQAVVDQDAFELVETIDLFNWGNNTSLWSVTKHESKEDGGVNTLVLRFSNRKTLELHTVNGSKGTGSYDAITDEEIDAMFSDESSDQPTVLRFASQDGLRRFLNKLKTMFVDGLGVSGDALTWTVGNRVLHITVPFATKAVKDANGNDIHATYATKNEVNAKQGTIDDLEEIRRGARLGATSIQEHQDISGKQDNIADLEEIRRGAALGATSIQQHQDISGKQDKLVSGGNIKTVNGQTLLGEGDIVIIGEQGVPGEKGDPFTYEDLTDPQKAEIAKDATAAAQQAAASAQDAANSASAAEQKVIIIDNAIKSLDPSQSTDDAVVALAAKQGAMEADLTALGPKISGVYRVPVTEGVAYDVAATFVSRQPTANASFNAVCLAVSKGEVFKIKGRGGASYRLWATADAARKVVRVAESQAVATTPIELTIQDGESYLVFQYNNTSTGEWYCERVNVADSLNAVTQEIKDNNVAKENYKVHLTSGAYIKASDGAIATNTNLSVSNFIPVTEGDVFVYHGYSGIESADIAAIAFYDGDKVYLNQYQKAIKTSITYKFTIPSGCKFVRICSRTEDFDYCYLENQNSKEIEAIKTRLANGITPDSCSFFVSKNLINPAILTSGKYVNYSNGTLETNVAFSVTDYIPVTPNTSYYINPGSQHAFYDSSKTFISGLHNTVGVFVSPSNAAFIRVSNRTEYLGVSWILAKSTASVPYSPYKLVIDEKYIALQGESGAKKYARKSDTLAQNGFIELATQYIRRNCVLSANVKSSGTINIRLGRGPTSTLYAAWVDIDSTNIVVKYNQSGAETTVATIPHGLTIADCLFVSLISDNGVGKVTLSTNSGYFVSEQFTWFGGGKPFLVNLSSASATAELTFSPSSSMFSKWVYQDSYGNYWQDGMWPYYILDRGFDKWMGDNLSGAGSSTLFSAFMADLSFDTPKYAVWALGMNDGADTNNTTPNATWLNYAQQFKAVCEGLGITPIYCTIPSIPSKLHSGKNYWIKNVSGCRYIDMADAVGAQDNGTWYDGMIRSDAVHPSVLGAKVLANRVLIDFPEIALPN